jgi:hypothetical protein
LSRNLKLSGKIIRKPSGSGKLNDLLPEFQRVGLGTFSGHWWIFPRQAESIHGTGPASLESRKIDGVADSSGSPSRWFERRSCVHRDRSIESPSMTRQGRRSRAARRTTRSGAYCIVRNRSSTQAALAEY